MRAQEAVLRFVLDAVRAEMFNDARTLFLFGSYTIGKERLFLEVARQLGKKVRNTRRRLATAPCSIVSAQQQRAIQPAGVSVNMAATYCWCCESLHGSAHQSAKPCHPGA